MNLAIICIFAALLTSVIVTANELTVAQRNLIDSLLGEGSKNIDAECFNKLKNELKAEFETGMKKYVDRVENGFPIFKKGSDFHLGRYIKDTLLPMSVVTANDDCLQQAREIMKKVLLTRFGEYYRKLNVL